jgi:Na+-transporting NADH:ubiquinone oxidoreductase subunit NqrB
MKPFMSNRLNWGVVVQNDPRHYQIATLGLLLIYGLVRLQVDIGLGRVAVILLTALAAQYFCARVWRLPFFDARSAMISGLSLCLLLRTNSIVLAMLSAVLTILSKFVVRWNGKHIFNPTNFGLAVMMVATQGRIWVSPGQWGDFAFFSFLVFCIGGLVVNRASRTDVTVAFLGTFVSLVFARSWWLGEPLSIPLHRLQNGALLIFSFFMISDPKTTPDSRSGRILFAVLVAFGAAFVQFRLFRTNGLLWSLAVFSVAVPLIDWLMPGQKYQWGRHTISPQNETQLIPIKESAYEPIHA